MCKNICLHVPMCAMYTRSPGAQDTGVTKTQLHSYSNHVGAGNLIWIIRKSSKCC